MNQHTPHPLDNAAWSALTTRQADLREGALHAFRYRADIAPFAAVERLTEESLRELAALTRSSGLVVFPSLAALPQIDDLMMESPGVLLQMIDMGAPMSSPSGGAIDDVVRLGEQDVPDMIALTEKTKPGPFGKRTREMGSYIGVRHEGQLVAMAGERMRLDGHTEISAVCVDDAHRGKGLAGRLINILREEIRSRGDTPFLHVFAHNPTAIGVYERLGFEVRQNFQLYRLTPR
ncbi:GNAT family N-acetyltransferase [Herbaspirillum rhizosphaerae]|uniref:GNAT family N-acetyltransferase n=1 Tax=Herbaspirillum rhizosphaerae TaxID=346179 RepID=UPI00067D79CC|nr:GNAT family N-acetyltransferase [Herbaspirillum rhizosphaerae]